MLISKISTEHQEAMEKKESEFNKEIQMLNASEKNLKMALDEMQKENGEMRKNLEEEEQLRKKLQDEIYKNIKSHEEEVQLRLQFESKLNGLHSLHRDLQAKYERALEDIYLLDFTQKAIKQKYDIIETEVVNLRALKIEQESKINYQEERIKSLQSDIDSRVRSYQLIEQKLLKAQ